LLLTEEETLKIRIKDGQQNIQSLPELQLILPKKIIDMYTTRSLYFIIVNMKYQIIDQIDANPKL
jgi:hypothetical protein